MVDMLEPLPSGKLTRQRSKSAILILAALAVISFYLLDEPDNQIVGFESSSAGQRVLLLDENFSCKWSPWSDSEGLVPLVEDLGIGADIGNTMCLNLLRDRLPPPQLQPRRWLFLGDSTMSRLFQLSDLPKALVESPLEQLEQNEECYPHVTCQNMQGSRCELNDLFDLPYPEHWVPPNRTDLHGLEFTGPVRFAASNPYCTDCSGCASNFVKCNLMTNVSITEGCDEKSKRKFLYGGYISMEFAQDIELQTPEYLTTQENLGAYIHRFWNTFSMVKEFGKPVCVLSAGIHETMIEGIQEDDYVKNVEFMLKQFTAVCDHIIWLGNTSPMSVDESVYDQTRDKMKSWDSAVEELIASKPQFFHVMSFVDVHDASLTWQHGDNIHMKDDWYQRLGNNLFLPLMQLSDPVLSEEAEMMKESDANDIEEEVDTDKGGKDNVKEEDVQDDKEEEPNDEEDPVTIE